MRRPAIGVTAMLAVLAALALPAWSQEPLAPELEAQPSNIGYGPFDAVSLSPFSSLRSGFLPLLPTSLAAGGFEARLDQSWAKVISSASTWLIDYEVARTRAALTWGITDSLSLQGELEASERAGGGALQRVILGFHRTFGVTTGYLTPYPGDLNRFQIVPPAGGPTVVVPSNDPQPYESSALVSLRQEITPGDLDVPAVSASVSLRRALAPGDLRGGAPVACAGSVGASKAAGPLFFTLGADVEWYGDQTFFGIRLLPYQWTVRAGVEWRCLPELSVVGQYLLKRGAVGGLADFSVPSNEISAGLVWEAAPGLLLELGILENVVNPYNTPDFGFYFAAALRW